MTTDPAWLTIALAEARREVTAGGAVPDARILAYLATCTDLEPGEADTDTTAWCAAFVNWCLTAAGEAGNNSCWAQRWADWGVPDSQPTRGSVVVWRRTPLGTEPGPFGHVAFLLDAVDDGASSALRVLGGNQDGRVCARSYPRDGVMGANAYSHIAFRRPT